MCELVRDVDRCLSSLPHFHVTHVFERHKITSSAMSSVMNVHIHVCILGRPLSDQLTISEIELLCQHLPKLELHAHLSGSVLESTLRELCISSGQVMINARKMALCGVVVGVWCGCVSESEQTLSRCCLNI